MRYLFIVQGDGRGHMMQALALSEILHRNGHEVIEVLVGRNKIRDIPRWFYQKIGTEVITYDSFSFVLKKDRKHIHLFKTILYNSQLSKMKKYFESIELIHQRIETKKPDYVINFFEILVGFSYLRYKEKIPIISIGHQFMIKHPQFIHGKGDEQGMMFLRLHVLLCSIGASKIMALSFYPLENSNNNQIITVPPLLRKEILKQETTEKDHILVYMLNSGYEDEIRSWHKKNPETKLVCFWDKKDEPLHLKIDQNLSFNKIDDGLFLEHLLSCKGYVSTAGFESICEAFYLGKPTMMIPAHIEQEVNAADAVCTGMGISGSRFNIDHLLEYIVKNDKTTNDSFRKWVNTAENTFLEHLTN